MNKYLEEFEKYKDCPIPEVDEVFNHPTQARGPFSQLPIQYSVTEYIDGNYGTVMTLHSGRKVKRTIHWIRKMYNKEK